MIFAVQINNCNCKNLKADIDLLAKLNGYETIGNEGNYYIIYTMQKKIFIVDVINLKIPIYSGKENRNEIEKIFLNAK